MNNQQNIENNFNNNTFILKIQETPISGQSQTELREQLLKEYHNSTQDKTYFVQNNLKDSNRTLYQISGNSFFDAFYAAYCLHGDVMISANDIWLTICIKFGMQINQNPEKYRNLFVNHQGKKQIEILLNGNYDEWINFPCQQNRWDIAMELFSQEIELNTTGNIANLMKNDFSSSNWIELASSNICLMSSMKNYFDYEMDLCGCGIQNVHFVGGIEDFEYLKTKITNLKQNYQLNQMFKNYLENILKTINTFIDHMKNPSNPDIPKFWNNIFQEMTVPLIGPSGFDIIGEQKAYTGWFKHFFDLHEIQKNDVPQFASQAPVKATHEINKKSYNLEFLTKMEGIEEFEPYIFRPNIVISVQEETQKVQ